MSPPGSIGGWSPVGPAFHPHLVSVSEIAARLDPALLGTNQQQWCGKEHQEQKAPRVWEGKVGCTGAFPCISHPLLSPWSHGMLSSRSGRDIQVPRQPPQLPPAPPTPSPWRSQPLPTGPTLAQPGCPGACTDRVCTRGSPHLHPPDGMGSPSAPARAQVPSPWTAPAARPGGTPVP